MTLGSLLNMRFMVLLSGFLVPFIASAQGVPYGPRGSYVVVAGNKTYKNAEWEKVIRTLRKKYNGDLIVYKKSLEDVRKPLRRIMPRYTCFVARPEELGRSFVVSVHRMTRKLDNDPYTDVVWGIITGYTPGDALRIAGRKKPLVVRRGLGGTNSLSLAPFDEGIKYSEGSKGGRWVKRANQAVKKEEFQADSTKGLVEGFNKFKPDLFMTSGHATTKDWQIGYTYRDGAFVCKNGQLMGKDTKGNTYKINSPNSKVYLPVGNCLIGNIPRRDCMALAFMHTGGVDQMFAYTAVTFFGYMGWGIKKLFEGRRDRYTLSEAFYFNNQALIHVLQTRFKRVADINLESFGRKDLGRMVKKHKLRSREELGFLWDRDVVAFYGDPAWEVRYPPGERNWECTFSQKRNLYCFEVRTRKPGNWGERPVMSFLPRRLAGIKVKEGKDLNPVLCDNFILLPLKGKFEGGETYRVVFSAKRARGRKTSASAAPVLAGDKGQ